VNVKGEQLEDKSGQYQPSKPHFIESIFPFPDPCSGQSCDKPNDNRDKQDHLIKDQWMMGPMHSGAAAAITNMARIKTNNTRRAAFLVDEERRVNIEASREIELINL
jgi:hypothetical protein